MLTRAPACRSVCNGVPGEVVSQLAEAFRKLRLQGVSEAQLLLVSRDPTQVAALLPADSLGALPGAAEAIVRSGCAECAVNLVYAR